MNKTIYILTSDETKQVALPKNMKDGGAQVVEAKAQLHEFNLTNTLKNSAMREAREVAKSAGLKLREPNTVAIR